jgi:hypothetical protein
MAGRHDFAARRRARRVGRQKGCSVYIPAEVLEAVGIDPNGPVPYFRTWAGPRRKSPTVLVKLYDEP